MTYKAAIRVAPTTTLARLNDPAWLNREPGRVMYDSSGFKLLKESVPLLVNHDEGRQIGSVKSLNRLDAGGPWLVATVEVTEKPDWLKSGTPASFAYVCHRMCSFGNPIVRGGFVTEVSVLSPGKAPAEPEAQVLYLNPVEPKPAPPPMRVPPNAQVLRRRPTPDDEIAELHRRLEWAGPGVRFEDVLLNLQHEIRYTAGASPRS